jgi:hypothetical protein
MMWIIVAIIAAIGFAIWYFVYRNRAQVKGSFNASSIRTLTAQLEPAPGTSPSTGQPLPNPPPAPPPSAPIAHSDLGASANSALAKIAPSSALSHIPFGIGTAVVFASKKPASLVQGAGMKVTNSIASGLEHIPVVGKSLGSPIKATNKVVSRLTSWL